MNHRILTISALTLLIASCASSDDSEPTERLEVDTTPSTDASPPTNERNGESSDAVNEAGDGESGDTAGDVVAVDDLLGTWSTGLAEMPSPDGSASAFVEQTIVFEPDAETLRTEAFADPDREQRLFTYESTGPYTDQGPWEPVDGARALDLVNESSLVTIFVDQPDLWNSIGVGNCNLMIGEAVEIRDCVDGPPFAVADCVDQDFVIVDERGERLRFGGGNVDRCETRPTEISDTAFFRAA